MIERVSSASPYEPEIGFCRALRVGDRVLVAGTAPIGEDGKCVPGDAAAQARRCLELIVRSIEKLGGRASDVVRTRLFLARRDIWLEVGRVHGEFFRDSRPVATMVVAQLLDEHWLVEIEAEALIQSRPT
jgi:enamine deaminase RidA (YjgF/YER057c/UK114 family)